MAISNTPNKPKSNLDDDLPREDDNAPEESVKPKTSKSEGSRSVPTSTSKSEAPEPKVAEEVTPQSYVWLANGEVLLVENEDLPGGSGAANVHGHWQKDGKVFEIVAVYPAEENAE
jgi:hypothetical protein